MEEENQATPEKDIPLSKSGRLVVAGRYHPGDELGKGAFSRVFRALDVVTGSLVAIKQVDILPLSARDKERIRQELDLLTRLIHPNIVSLIDFEETEEYFNFILEYIEGGSLHSLKGKYGNIPEPLLSYFMFQTLKGLQYLHSFKIMHRDIKGANILLTKSGECKLADFGSCSDSFGDRQITMIGTPYWMAPELISQTGGGPASDIWSLGCTILELFTGQPPYWKLNSNLALYRMVEDPHPPLPSNCSEDLQEFLFNCFLKDEKMRYTATELLQHPWIVQHSNFDRTQKRILPKMFPELVLSPPATLPEQKEKKPEKKHKKLTAFGKKKDKNKEHESEAHEKLQRSKTGEMVSSRRMTTPSHEVHTRSDELLLNYVQSVEGGPSTARRRGALPTEELRHTAEPSSESPTSPHSSRGPSRSPPPSSSPSTSPTLANVSTDLDIPTSSDFKDADNEHSEKSILVEMEEELNLEIKELRTGLKQWKKKMTKLVPDKINLELQRDAFQTETQMLFRRKEDLEAKRDFVKDFEARQKKEGDLIDEEIVTLLSRLEDELHSSQLEISLTPSDNSVCWMVPGALCLVRESATHRWEDAVITCLEDSVDIVLFNVILIETGETDKVQASDIRPALIENLSIDRKHKKGFRTFKKKEKLKSSAL